jgi:hypothetical protein
MADLSQSKQRDAASLELALALLLLTVIICWPVASSLSTFKSAPSARDAIMSSLVSRNSAAAGNTDDPKELVGILDDRQ